MINFYENLQGVILIRIIYPCLYISYISYIQFYTEMLGCIWVYIFLYLHHDNMSV